MRLITTTVVCLGLLLANCYADDAANYIVTINGKPVDVNLGKEYSVSGPKGEKLTVKVEKKEIGTYEGEFFSFRHKSEHGVTSTDLGDGIRQIMTASALGTVILFQEYNTVNPETLVDFMVREVTKDDVEAGYELTSKPITRTLQGGIKLKGVEATVSGNGDMSTYWVFGYGKKSRGVLVMTIMDKDNVKVDQGMLDLLWESLKFKF